MAVRKIYKLNQPKNTATFDLTGKNGNRVRYIFKDGNQLNRIPARCVLENEYCQWLLENSKLFKDGIIKLERTIGDEKPVEAPKTKTLKAVDSVNTLEKAIEYIANTWAGKVTTIKQANNFAEKMGYCFPNLKAKEKEPTNK